MTAGGILPNYQRFVNGVPVPFSRKSFRPREKYVIFLVFITFGLVCFGTFFFLPEFKGSKSTADSVYKVYDKIKKAGPELLIPPPPHLEDDKDTLKLVRHDIDGQPDPHVIDDREKLKAKIEQDEQLKVLERPDMGLNKKTSSSTIRSIVKPLDQAPLRGPETNLLIKEGSDIITVPPAPSDHYPKTIGGEDEDPEARERRNKVKEVSASHFLLLFSLILGVLLYDFFLDYCYSILIIFFVAPPRTSLPLASSHVGERKQLLNFYSKTYNYYKLEGSNPFRNFQGCRFYRNINFCMQINAFFLVWLEVEASLDFIFHKHVKSVSFIDGKHASLILMSSK